jgi:hypothetical protein
MVFSERVAEQAGEGNMAENTSGSGVTGIVAIVAIVILVMMGFFIMRGARRGGDSPGVKGNIEFKAPTPAAPSGQSPRP